MTSNADFPEFVRSLPEIEMPFPGCRGWLLQGEMQQVAFIEFLETVEVPEHEHEDQWELPVAGRVELRRAGKAEKHGAGDAFFIPAGQPHGATVHKGYRAIIVFDAVARYQARS